MSAHPHLELIEGGLTNEDADWHRFCERIGWQQLGEPSLPDDYEDRLVERIFEAPEDNVVSIVDGATVTGLRLDGAWRSREAADAESLVGPFLGSRSLARTLGAAVAVAAAVALVVVAVSHLVGDAPPAARTVPTPAPERAPRPEPPLNATPEGELPELVEIEPEQLHARVPTRSPRISPVVDDRSEATVAPPSPPSSVAQPARLAAISPEADGATASSVSATLPAHLSLPVMDASVGRRPMAWGTEPLSPTWRHLAITPGSLAADHQAVALVDVVEAGRSLRGAL